MRNKILVEMKIGNYSCYIQEDLEIGSIIFNDIYNDDSDNIYFVCMDKRSRGLKQDKDNLKDAHLNYDTGSYLSNILMMATERGYWVYPISVNTYTDEVYKGFEDRETHIYGYFYLDKKYTDTFWTKHFKEESKETYNEILFYEQFMQYCNTIIDDINHCNEIHYTIYDSDGDAQGSYLDFKVAFDDLCIMMKKRLK